MAEMKTDSSLAHALASLSLSDEQHIMRDCLRLMQSQIDKLTMELCEPFESNVEVTRDKIQTLMKLLHHQCSKFVVFISQTPSARDRLPIVSSLTEEFINQLTAFVCTLRTILPTAGNTLKQQVIAGGKTVLSAISSLIDQVSSLISLARPVDPHIVGIAWDSCKSIENIPLTNDAAINKALMTHLQLVKDARSEMTKFKETPQAEQGRERKQHHEDEDEDEDEDEELNDSDFDNMSDNEDITSLSHHEFIIVAPCTDLCGLTYVMFRHLCGFALRCKDRSPGHVSWLEAQLSSASGITRAVDEMGEALYHPQDPRAITRATTHITSTLATMLRAFADNPAFSSLFKADEQKTSTPSTTFTTSTTWMAPHCTICPPLPDLLPSCDATTFFQLFVTKLHSAHSSLGVTDTTTAIAKSDT